MSLFTPTRRIATVDKINLQQLKDDGIKLILIDRDNTCIPRSTRVCPDEILDWFKQVKEYGMVACIVSNNIHSDQVQKTADYLGCEKIDHAMKPNPKVIRQALANYKVSSDQAVMVGDQYFTDIFAGNLAGMKTILVKPQSEVELWYTKLFLRPLERLIWGREIFEGDTTNNI